jgi:hypothetical protein
MSGAGESRLKSVIGVRVRLLALTILIVDPRKHETARASAKIWCLAMEALAEQMTRYIPNDEQRSEFVDGVKDDVQNKEYQLYCNMYAITRMWLTLGMS